MDSTTGLLDWNTEMDYWNTFLAGLTDSLAISALCGIAAYHKMVKIISSKSSFTCSTACVHSSLLLYMKQS